jgi:hypothetical protein
MRVERAQHFRLHLQAHVADFVEERRAGINGEIQMLVWIVLILGDQMVMRGWLRVLDVE